MIRTLGRELEFRILGEARLTFGATDWIGAVVPRILPRLFERVLVGVTPATPSSCRRLTLLEAHAAAGQFAEVPAAVRWRNQDVARSSAGPLVEGPCGLHTEIGRTQGTPVCSGICTASDTAS